MFVSYAAAKSAIKLPSLEHQAKMGSLLERVIQTSLKSLKMPDEGTDRAQVQESLINRGKQQLEEIMMNQAE